MRPSEKKALPCNCTRSRGGQEGPAGYAKKAREIGFEYVQWSGMPDLPADKIRAALDAAGLKAISAHIVVEAFEKDFAKEVRFWKTVGVHDVATRGMMKDCKANLAGLAEGVKRLDALGAKLREVGMRLSYHNHSFEFEKFPGDPRCKIDIMLESTRPENLSRSSTWPGSTRAGRIRRPISANTRAAARQCTSRTRCRPRRRRCEFTPLGQGALNWQDIFAAGQEAKIEWYIYEQDSGKGSPFDYTRISYEFLKKNLQ